MAAAVVVVSGHAHDVDEPPSSVGVTVSVLACLALAGRRRYPGATVVATAAFALPVLALDPTTAPYALLVPVAALFSYALFGSRMRQLVGGVGCVAVATAAELLNRDPPGLLYTMQHLGFLLVPILAAETLRSRSEYRSAARQQEAQRRVADERLSIARDLHDVIAHTLTTINVQASVAGHLLDSRPERARHALSVIEETSRDGIDELRAILGILRGADGVAPLAPEPGLGEVTDLVELARKAGLETGLEVTGERPPRVPEAVSRAAYRIVQEALTNVARHSAGAAVQVQLSFGSDELAITVENTARRRPLREKEPVAPNNQAGLNGATSRVGILGMTERATALGGTLTTTESGTGFLVRARLPYRKG